MKLVIQIPCYNEIETLAVAVRDLPRTVPGFDTVEYLVIDDGSTDGTPDEAHRLGVHHVVRHPRNLGLARAFQTGLDAALRLNADVIVNTDADGQYPGRYIAALTAPLVAGTADICIGDRQTHTIAHFSALKRTLQRLGTRTICSLSGIEVKDAASGFRAYSADAALRLTVLTRFSYTMETLIQAGKTGLTVCNLPITTNPPRRPSRLQKNMLHFIAKQTATMLRMYALYEPFKTFLTFAAPFLIVGLGSWARYFYFLYFEDHSEVGRHIQSITIGSGVLVVGVMILFFGLHAAIAGKHRQLAEVTLYRLRKLEYRLFQTAEVSSKPRDLRRFAGGG